MEKFYMYNDKQIWSDWRDYAIHDDKNIKGFFAEYRFLSNFEPCNIVFDGLEYKSSENAYQAAKLKSNEDRKLFQELTASKSKRIWREVEFNPNLLTDNWHESKYDIMKTILNDKFTRNLDLRNKLIETGDKYLEETNHWKDIFWGVYFKTNEGENNLGKLLMEIRQNFINKSIF